MSGGFGVGPDSRYLTSVALLVVHLLFHMAEKNSNSSLIRNEVQNHSTKFQNKQTNGMKLRPLSIEFRKYHQQLWMI